MNFTKALHISFAVHIAVLGSALAFAQLGRGAFGPYSDSIMVSLVGSGGSSQRQDRAQAAENRPTREDRSSPDPDAVAIRERNANDFHQDRGEAGLSDEDGRMKAGSDGSAKAAGDDGGKSGLIPPETWQLIQSAIERAKRYPRLARERGIEGVVQLRFKLNASGAVEKVEILKSSGHRILDAASITTVQRATSMPYVQGWIEVPMEYVLK
jgi:protein TonB